MSAGPADGAYAVGLLIIEAWAAVGEVRLAAAEAAAGRAVTGAELAGDPVLLVRALNVRAAALRLSGDNAAALVDYTRVLGLAEDPATVGGLGGDDAAWAVAGAYMYWVEAARFRGGVAVRQLFAVLDAGERWMSVTGRTHWRAGLLYQRANLHRRLGEREAAIAFAEEALTAHRPGSPGPSRAALRSTAGDVLCDAQRHEEAAPYYQAILDDRESNSYDRAIAHQGLAHCAVAGVDSGAAREHVVAAVRLAEGFGGPVLCAALEASVTVHRANEDLDAAWEAATRLLEVAGRVGGHYRLCRAVQEAVDVALDRADADGARALLADLDRHATALDADIATTRFTDEAAQRHGRLARLTPAGGPADD